MFTCIACRARAAAYRSGMSHLSECLMLGVFCPKCYSGQKGRQSYAGHFGYRAPKRHGVDECMTLQKRSKAGSNGSAAKVQDWTGTILSGFPTLCEFLALDRWPDGTNRLTGTLQLFCEHGKWKVTLRDRDAKEYAFLTSDTIEELLLTVEEGLTQGNVEWRPDKPFVPKR